MPHREETHIVETQSDRAPSRRLPHTRRRKQILFVLLVLGMIEGAAWLADYVLEFRVQILQTYRLRARSDVPVISKTDVSHRVAGQNRSITIRSSREKSRMGGTSNFRIAGRTIADATGNSWTDRVEPEDVVSQTGQRVFIVGGSAAFGFPYRYSDSFGAILEKRLGDSGSQVFNSATVGATSGYLVPVVEKIVENFDPQVLIIYSGNNEWFHWSHRPPRPSYDFSKLSEHSGINRGAKGVLRCLSLSRALAGVQYGFLKMARLKQQQLEEERHRKILKKRRNEPVPFYVHTELSGLDYALKNPLSRQVLDPQQWLLAKQKFLSVFESNLLAMVRAAQQNNVRVLLLTVPFNYKLSPAWKHPQPESFDQRYEATVRRAIRDAADLIANKRYDEALITVDAALDLDPLPSVLHYQRAMCLEAQNHPLLAEQAYAQCREHMIGHLGGRLSINESIAQIADRTGATLVDLCHVFDEYGHSRERYFNIDLIHDDCHPTPLAQRLIAQTLLTYFEDDMTHQAKQAAP